VSATRPRSGSSIDLAHAVFLAEGSLVVVLEEAVVLLDDVRLGVSAVEEQEARTTAMAIAEVSTDAFLIPDIVSTILRLSRGARRQVALYSASC
jgi:hypothetical protein